MNEIKGGSGSCLCGAVRFSASSMGKSVGACHCKVCRKWGGGPFFEVECGPDVLFEGVENISTFRSSSWGERGFCKQCGTHLYLKVKEDNELGLPGGYGVPAGLLVSEEELVFATEVFIDHKPSYYSFSNLTKEIGSEEVYEKHPEVRDGDT